MRSSDSEIGGRFAATGYGVRGGFATTGSGVAGVPPPFGKSLSGVAQSATSPVFTHTHTHNRSALGAPPKKRRFENALDIR